MELEGRRSISVRQGEEYGPTVDRRGVRREKDVMREEGKKVVGRKEGANNGSICEPGD